MSYRITALIIATVPILIPFCISSCTLSDKDKPGSAVIVEYAARPQTIYISDLMEGNGARADTANPSGTAQYDTVDTAQIEAGNLHLHQAETAITTREDTLFAKVTYSHDCLKIIRNKESIDATRNIALLPGDKLETCSRHFAMVDFYPGGTMTLFPASNLVLKEEGSYLSLMGAEILFENDQNKTTFPEVVSCFGETMYHNQGTARVSFGVHCRGESGLILTSKEGSIWWSCKGTPCEVLAGEGLMGRITTANFASVTLPDQPRMTTAYVVPNHTAPDIHPQDDNAAIQNESGFTATIIWSPVSMADQYLVHIYQENDSRIHHTLTTHHQNQFSTELPYPGLYLARVMAIDFYGVTSRWSDPVTVIVEPGADVIPEIEEDSLHNDLPRHPSERESMKRSQSDSRQL